MPVIIEGAYNHLDPLPNTTIHSFNTLGMCVSTLLVSDCIFYAVCPYLFSFVDIFLSGAYTRPLDPFIYHSLHYPYYKMANSKGSSFESDSSVLKKPRTVFTPKQLLHLEEEFVKNPFPNMEQRKLIAKDLDLTQQHIQVKTMCYGLYITVCMCE